MPIGNIKIQMVSAPHLDETFSYALTGCNRVHHLIEIYLEARNKSGKTRGRVWTHLSDILRAAVVLCHANLEQVLRDLMLFDAEWTPEFLQRIALVDTKHARADRFSLADLAAFGDQPVSEVVFESVSEHLSKRSFTQVSDVIDVLTMCGFDIADYRKYFPDIQALMEQRHHIAHTADLEENPGKGKQMTRSLSVRTVYRWSRSVQDFILTLSFKKGLGSGSHS